MRLAASSCNVGIRESPDVFRGFPPCLLMSTLSPPVHPLRSCLSQFFQNLLFFLLRAKRSQVMMNISAFGLACYLEPLGQIYLFTQTFCLCRRTCVRRCGQHNRSTAILAVHKDIMQTCFLQCDIFRVATAQHVFLTKWCN